MVAIRIGLFVILAGAFASAEPTIGSISSIEELPSIAQVEVRVGLLWVQQCVASVLTNRHVLSSATCFSGDLYLPQNRRIRAGTSYRSSGGVVFGVETAVLHPSFGLLGLEGDLTVVKLDDYLTLSSTVQQVAILGQGIELPLGLEVLLAGWGTTVQGGDSADTNLYSLSLNVHDNEYCTVKYIGNEIVTENMVCVGLGFTQGRDFQSHDLGAPIYFSNTLIGILSFGEEADDELPLVATNIGSYTEWIIETAGST